MSAQPHMLCAQSEVLTSADKNDFTLVECIFHRADDATVFCNAGPAQLINDVICLS